MGLLVISLKVSNLLIGMKSLLLCEIIVFNKWKSEFIISEVSNMARDTCINSN